jgi:signal transduction histidine kinase
VARKIVLRVTKDKKRIAPHRRLFLQGRGAGGIRGVPAAGDLEAQLLQTRKMEAIGALAGGVAHDFNNILMGLMGYANLLQIKMGRNDPLRAYVDKILACTGKAAGITQNLLAFCGKQAAALKPHNVSAIVRDVEKVLQRLLPEDIRLTVVYGDDVHVMADLTHIEQVLVNVTTNARDAMPKGGDLRIETTRIELDQEFRRTHGYGAPGTYSVLSVADTGTGMDEATKEKIFEPFYTTKEPGKGTGLGLSIVYGIIRQHGGFINVRSQPDKGTIFRIYLPEARTKECAPGAERRD